MRLRAAAFDRALFVAITIIVCTVIGLYFYEITHRPDLDTRARMLVEQVLNEVDASAPR